MSRFWEDLKWPTTSKNGPETTWSNPQRAKNHLQKKHSKRTTTSRCWDNSTIWGNEIYSLTRFSLTTFDCNDLSMALWRIIMEIQDQTFINYHVYLLQDIKFAGYVTNHLDTPKLTFARQKLTLWIKLDLNIKFWHR